MPTFTHTLLDTGVAEDAYACGHDKRMPVEMGGLKITFEADRDLGPCVTLNGQDGEIRLIGEAEIDEVIRALTNAKLRSARVAALAMAAE